MNPFSRLSLLWKIVLSFSVAITLLFAATFWITMRSATRATAESNLREVQASFHAYQSLWKSRSDRLSSISAILSAMSDVRAAFSTGDEATIRDTAKELWSRVSDDDAIFLVTTPRGRVIASLGGASAQPLPEDMPAVREAAGQFPAQVSGFLALGEQLYHITITPVYVQASQGQGLLNVLVAGYAVSEAVAAHLKATTGGSEFLFLSHGVVVASTLSTSDSAIIARQLASSPTVVRTGSSAFAPLLTPLKDLQGSPVGQLAILHSVDAANQEITNLRRNIGLLWLVSLLAGLGLTYFMALRIVEPVKRLDRAAAEVAARNYDSEVPVKSQDELGRLARTFNTMCASIRQAREDLIRSERIGAVGRLAASIVHDLRNPLAAIYGGAELLLESQLSAPQIQRLAANMYDSSRRIQLMLQDLLELGRPPSGRHNRHSLREVVSSVTDSLALDAEMQGVQVQTEIPDHLEANLDRHRIERVVANLIGNALEAMPGGGRITITAMDKDGFVLIAIRDTGPGIDPEIRDRLFQPFVSGRKGAGMGLGLALSRQAVIDHGGEMWVESNPGEGACFTFRLPQARP